MTVRILPGADVDASAALGEGTTVWHLAQVREDAVLGAQVIVGRGAYVDHGVRIGDRCKLQNYALVYAPAQLGDGVFVGPGAILTNDTHPRAVDPDGTRKDADDWEPEQIVVGDGASIGAGAVVVAGVSIGAWALIGAGAVVTADVPAHALVVGVPARQVGWVGHAGSRLEEDADGTLRCPRTGDRYELRGDAVRRLA